MHVSIGDHFGHWTVIGSSNRHSYVLCRCDCGKEKEVYVYNLLRGQSLSCGCHRQDKNPEKYQRSLIKGHALSSEMHKKNKLPRDMSASAGLPTRIVRLASQEYHDLMADAIALISRSITCRFISAALIRLMPLKTPAKQLNKGRNQK